MSACATAAVAVAKEDLEDDRPTTGGQEGDRR
jgi:hypothetical protein